MCSSDLRSLVGSPSDGIDQLQLGDGSNDNFAPQGQADWPQSWSAARHPGAKRSPISATIGRKLCKRSPNRVTSSLLGARKRRFSGRSEVGLSLTWNNTTSIYIDIPAARHLVWFGNGPEKAMQRRGMCKCARQPQLPIMQTPWVFSTYSAPVAELVRRLRYVWLSTWEDVKHCCKLTLILVPKPLGP